MLNILKDRQRRHSSSSKQKSSCGLQQINLNMFQAYLPEKKGKQSHYGSRVNGKENHRNRKSQEIKQNGILGVKFKNNFVQCKQRIKEAEVKHKLSFRNLQADTFGENKDKMNITFQTLQPNQTSNHKKGTSQKNNTTPKVKNGQYLQRYQAAIATIFKNLDIFNRGTITQTNINKWIPEEALYFLGKVFQKIRQERLYLSNDQFFKLCLPILYESNQEDIEVFLQQVTGKQITHTVSIDFPSQEKNNSQSPVQYKITKDTGFNLQANKTMALIEYQKSQYKPLVPCEDLIGSIKQKQKVLNQRLNMIKEKQNIYNERNTNTYSLKKNEPSIHISNSKKKYVSNQNYNPKVSNFESHKKSLSELQKQQVKICSDLAKNQFNFSFQLPEFKNYQTSKQNSVLPTKNHQKLLLKNEFKLQNEVLNLNQVQKNPTLLRTSRIVRQNVRPKQTNSHQKRQIVKQQDTQRIDRLSSRLQQYIKYNKQKIEKNTRFIRENSAPKT